MSLIVYNQNIGNETSVILHDPNTKSLVLYDKSTGKISLTANLRYGNPRAHTPKIASPYSSQPNRCPHCGNILNSQSYFMHENYFQLLQEIPSAVETPTSEESNAFMSFSIFAQGYYKTFFNELAVLGNGARGAVYKVEHVLVDHNLGVYALKKIPIGDNLDWLNKCIQEVKFMNSVTQDCLHLVKYNHVWLERSISVGRVRTRSGTNNNEEFGEELPYMFILQQFCPGGNLESVINERVFHKLTGKETSEERKKLFKLQRSNSGPLQKGLKSSQILSIASDLAHGLQELHSLDIIHRDLKPSNCLLLEEYNPACTSKFPKILIGDFGESQLRGQLRTATGATGTMEYTAPELIISETSVHEKLFKSEVPQFTFQSDMYSLGMILYYVVFGELPFTPGMQLAHLKTRIKQYTCSIQAMQKRHQEMSLSPIHVGIFGLINQLLSPKAALRPSAEETITLINELQDTIKTEMKARKSAATHRYKTFLKLFWVSCHLATSLLFFAWHRNSPWNNANLLLLGVSFNCPATLSPYILAINILLFFA